VLDELVDGYRSDVLERAQRSASRLGGDYNEISVHDVLTGLESLRSNQLGIRIPPDRDVYSIMLAAVTVGFGSVLFYVLTRSSGSILSFENISLLVALISLYLGLGVFFLQRLRYRKSGRVMPFTVDSESGDRQSLELTVVQRWRDIELCLRDLSAKDRGESTSTAPIGSLIETLGKDGVLSPDDVSSLRRILQVRNAILHKRGSVPREDLARAQQAADQLLDHLGRESRHSGRHVAF